MLKNYFTVAWRAIRRNKSNSHINIAGLAIGMTCVVLIALYVQDEMSFDSRFQIADRIYQVNLYGTQDGTDFQTGNTPPTVGPALASEIPEIESFVRIYKPGDMVVRTSDGGSGDFFTEKRILGVDSNFLLVFDYEMLKGNRQSCLNGPHSIVISEQIAEKYFGTTDVLGKSLSFDKDPVPFSVTGVIKHQPGQVTWQFDMLTPISAYPVVKRFSWSWVWLQVNTYVVLKDQALRDGGDLAELEKKFPAVVKKHAASAFRRLGQPLEEFYKKGGRWDFHLQPLRDVHLLSAGIGSRISTLGDIRYVLIFSAIAFFIVLLACVNFMNLSTAQSAKRAKEVGIRKTLGSGRKQMVRQFFAEAILQSSLAAGIAVLLAVLFLKPFNAVSGKSFELGTLFANGNWLLIPTLALVSGILAGAYPAFYLSSFRPAEVLKKTLPGNATSLFRNGLVVFQFSVSTVLLICTLIVYHQLRFMQDKDIGLTKDNVLVISNAQRLGESLGAYRQELATIQGIGHVGITSSNPTVMNFADGYLPQKEPGQQIVEDISLPSFVVDEEFIPALNIQMLSGRNFSKDFFDSASVILNESAVKQIGWKNPLGKELEYPGNSQLFRVIGVAKDFNLQSLHSETGPFALFHISSKTYDLGYPCLLAQIGPGENARVLKEAEAKWKAFAPAAPFDYTFLDEDFQALYHAEHRMGTLFGIFTVLSVFIGCLGLFGLAAYTAERRTKEIGIRKVLGASVNGLVALLSKDFLRLVLIASVIAFPVAWWSMSRWLEDFAYRIPMPWWIFPAAAALALSIAFFTVSVHAVRAALANPVTSLRTE